MNRSDTANYLDGVAGTDQDLLLWSDSNSRSAYPHRDDQGFDDPESRGAMVFGPASGRVAAVIQNARMTFKSFVETKFIPEHVEHKTLAGRTHYQAMLKHLIPPEAVQRIFNPRKAVTA